MRSDTIKLGDARAPHRSLLRATGVEDDDFRKPFIADLQQPRRYHSRPRASR